MLGVRCGWGFEASEEMEGQTEEDSGRERKGEHKVRSYGIIVGAPLAAPS